MSATVCNIARIANGWLVGSWLEQIDVRNRDVKAHKWPEHWPLLFAYQSSSSANTKELGLNSDKMNVFFTLVTDSEVPGQKD